MIRKLLPPLFKGLTSTRLKDNARNACNKAATSQIITKSSRETDSVNPTTYCAAHVKKYDRDNFYAAQYIKYSMPRRIMLALRAFNVELSLVRDSTTNSDRAKLRFHFWSKLVEEIVRRNDEADPNLDKLNAYFNYAPVARELLDLFYLVNVDDNMKKWLNDLIGARISSKVLGYKSFETLTELELYCSKSNSSLYHLSWNIALQLHKQVRDVGNLQLEDMKSTAETLGVAHGLSNIIRGILYNSTRNCCYIPKDLLKEHELTSRDFVNKKLDGNKIAPVVKVLADRCQKLINDVHSGQKSIPDYFRHLFLSHVFIQHHLNRLKKSNYNVCDPDLTRRRKWMLLNMLLVSIYPRFPIF